MLVLSRQRDETIMIGDEIEITVVDIRGDKVRLGITAPTRVSVHRKEVYEAIKAENQRASQINNADLPKIRGNPAPGTTVGPQRLRPRAAPLPGASPGPAARLRPPGEQNPGTSFGGAQTA
ncbi:MAG: carbon storage regulator CsrA [Phycisphaerales bacterium]